MARVRRNDLSGAFLYLGLQVLNDAAKGGVRIHLILNTLLRVDHGRMIPATEV